MQYHVGELVGHIDFFVPFCLRDWAQSISEFRYCPFAIFSFIRTASLPGVPGYTCTRVSGYEIPTRGTRVHVSRVPGMHRNSYPGMTWVGRNSYPVFFLSAPKCPGTGYSGTRLGVSSYLDMPMWGHILFIVCIRFKSVFRYYYTTFVCNKRERAGSQDTQSVPHQVCWYGIGG